MRWPRYRSCSNDGGVYGDTDTARGTTPTLEEEMMHQPLNDNVPSDSQVWCPFCISRSCSHDIHLGAIMSLRKHLSWFVVEITAQALCMREEAQETWMTDTNVFQPRCEISSEHCYRANA